MTLISDIKNYDEAIKTKKRLEKDKRIKENAITDSLKDKIKEIILSEMKKENILVMRIIFEVFYTNADERNQLFVHVNFVEDKCMSFDVSSDLPFNLFENFTLHKQFLKTIIKYLNGELKALEINKVYNKDLEWYQVSLNLEKTND